MQRRGSFKPFKLPSSALFFKPPRTKTENMQKKDFLGHAKVVASVQDNDDFTGFLGAQGQVRESVTPLPTVVALCAVYSDTPIRSCSVSLGPPTG